jgi:hypothetical protein
MRCAGSPTAEARNLRRSRAPICSRVNLAQTNSGPSERARRVPIGVRSPSTADTAILNGEFELPCPYSRGRGQAQVAYREAEVLPGAADPAREPETSSARSDPVSQLIKYAFAT